MAACDGLNSTFRAYGIFEVDAVIQNEQTSVTPIFWAHDEPFVDDSPTKNQEATLKASQGNMKRYMTTILKSSLLLLGVAGGSAAFAQVPKADCTPLVFGASSTMTITQPGVYCMTSDLIVTSFDASTPRAHLYVSSDNVTVDFNGYTMKSAGSTYEIGVAIQSGNTTLNNVTLRNGRLSGFWMGVYANGANGLLVEGMQLDACTSTCITANVSHSIFRSNIVAKTTPTAWYGISSYGDANKFIGNSISGLNTNGVVPIYGLAALVRTQSLTATP